MEEIKTETAGQELLAQFSDGLAAQKNLLAKMVRIYEAIDHVEKRGNNAQQSYKYVKASDVAREIREALIKEKIYAEPSFSIVRHYDIMTNAGKAMQAVDVECIVRFADAESGAEVLANGFGGGCDSGDKALYKAQTGALKSALRYAFMLPDESDPEGDPETDKATTQQTRTATQPSAKRTTSATAPPKQPVQAPVAATGRSETNAAEPSSTVSIPKAVIPAQNSSVTAAESTTYEGKASPSEFVAARDRAQVLSKNLKTAGMAPTEETGGTVGKKVLQYILSTTGKEKITDLSQSQWTTVLGALEGMVVIDPQKAIAAIEEKIK